MIKVTVLLFLVLQFVASILAEYQRVTLEHPGLQNGIPKGWSHKGLVNSNTKIELTFALKQQNIDILDEKFQSCSNPKNPGYAQYWTLDEVNAITGPSKLTISTVTKWILSEVPNAQINMAAVGWLKVIMTAEEAEQLLGGQIKFAHFKHETANINLIRSITGVYSVPIKIADHLDFIGGIFRFPKVRKQLRIPNAGIEVTPHFLRKHYNVSGASGKSSKNLQAVAQFLKQYYSALDLDEFFLGFSQENLGKKVEKVIGPNHFPAGIEASLDIEYIMSVGVHIRTWFISTGGLFENQEPFLDWIISVENMTEIPYVHTVSYGDDEPSVTFSYAQRVDEEFRKIGTRGISILFASGDDGAGCQHSGSRFMPNWPASSPYVTAVGGTSMDPFLTGTEHTNFISGGGFSDRYRAQDYQLKAIAAYVKDARKLPEPSYWNATGRGYPDISALSSGFTVVANFIPLPGVAGTSCSAPVTGAIFSLLNDIRFQNNKNSLGFLNPFLYQTAAEHPEGFFDVIHDCQGGCISQVGFCAARGWDPATGVGTPNYATLSKIVLGLP